MNEFLTGLTPGHISSIITLTLIAFFRSQVVNFINEFCIDTLLYLGRKHDKDGNPLTGEWAPVKCPVTGGWIIVYVKSYYYHILPSKRKANILWPYKNGQYIETMMTYRNWRTFLSGKMPQQCNFKINPDSDNGL